MFHPKLMLYKQREADAKKQLEQAQNSHSIQQTHYSEEMMILYIHIYF